MALTHHLADLESAAADPDLELVRLCLEAARGEGERFDLIWRGALRRIERREVASLAEDRQRSYAVRSLRDLEPIHSQLPARTAFTRKR